MFLANENFPRPGILLLRNHGYEVKSIPENEPGSSDQEVLKITNNLGLIILTFDKDYGELIFRYAPEKTRQLIFREKGNDPLFAGQMLINLLTSADLKLENSFTVTEELNIRQRFYKK